MSREMKDSGVEWIGDVPSEWTVFKLKNLIESPLSYGANSSGIEYDKSLPRYIRITDISGDNKLKDENKLSLPWEDAKAYMLKNNDLLFARSGGTVGKTFLYKEQFGQAAFAGYLIKASFINEIFAKWVYYYSLSQGYNEWKNRIFIRATIQNIGASKYSNMEIALPQTDFERNKIVNLLERKLPHIDTIIEQTKTTIEDYKLLKQSIITEAVTKGLDKNVEMKESGIEWIGTMPAHWDRLRGKVILNKLSRPILDSDTVVTCFRDGEVTLRSNRREDGFTMADKEIGYQGVEPGDLVVHGMDGFAGAIGISDSRGKSSPVLNVLDSKQNKKYIMYYLRSMAYSDVFIAIATGIRVRSCDLRWNKIGDLPYPVPPMDEQEEIVEHIDNKLIQINEVIERKQGLLEQLETYKKSLIYEYVTGKKEVE